MKQISSVLEKPYSLPVLLKKTLPSLGFCCFRPLSNNISYISSVCFQPLRLPYFDSSTSTVSNPFAWRCKGIALSAFRSRVTWVLTIHLYIHSCKISLQSFLLFILFYLHLFNSRLVTIYLSGGVNDCHEDNLIESKQVQFLAERTHLLLTGCSGLKALSVSPDGS